MSGNSRAGLKSSRSTMGTPSLEHQQALPADPRALTRGGHGKGLESICMVYWEMPQRRLSSGEAGKPSYLPTPEQLRHTKMTQPGTERSEEHHSCQISPTQAARMATQTQQELLDGGGEVSASPSTPDLSPQEVGRTLPGDEQILAVASGIWGAKHFSTHLPFLPLPLLLVSAPLFSFGEFSSPHCIQPCPINQGALLNPGQGWAHDQSDPLS